MSRIDEIRGRLEAATPRPWQWLDTMDNEGLITASCLANNKLRKDILDAANVLNEDEPYLRIRRQNAALIAHAPEDIKYLLDRVEGHHTKMTTALAQIAHQEAYIKKLEAAAKVIRDPCYGCESPFCTLDEGGAPCTESIEYNNLKAVMEGWDE